jgi:hypothetical protein
METNSEVVVVVLKFENRGHEQSHGGNIIEVYRGPYPSLD